MSSLSMSSLSISLKTFETINIKKSHLPCALEVSVLVALNFYQQHVCWLYHKVIKADPSQYARTKEEKSESQNLLKEKIR